MTNAQAVLGLVGTALLGGAVPLIARRSHRLLHLFVALATGVFLGIVFLHLLPHALDGHDDGLHAPWPGVLVLAGVLALFVVQTLLLPGGASQDPHVASGWSSFVGLSVHAFAEGVALAATHGGPAFDALLLSVMVHKVAEGFSLATVLALGGRSPGRGLLLVGLFALVTPVGLVLGDVLVGELSRSAAHAFTAIATGTVLFVTLNHLLPEVFHGREDRVRRLALLVVGIVVALTAHVHEA